MDLAKLPWLHEALEKLREPLERLLDNGSAFMVLVTVLPLVIVIWLLAETALVAVREIRRRGPGENGLWRE